MLHPVTVRRDPDGAWYSDALCFRCAQAGPHWKSRHALAGEYSCRRCFATFADVEPAGSKHTVLGQGLAVPEPVQVFETK